MTISDPIGDMLTRIRNAVAVGHPATSMPSSRMKVAIAEIMQAEGFIDGFDVVTEPEMFPTLRVSLRYVGERRKRRPVIAGIVRVSRPGMRGYSGKAVLPRVLSGMGIAIISTPKGLMTDQRARKLGVGGEVICRIW